MNISLVFQAVWIAGFARTFARLLAFPIPVQMSIADIALWLTIVKYWTLNLSTCKIFLKSSLWWQMLLILLDLNGSLLKRTHSVPSIWMYGWMTQLYPLFLSTILTQMYLTGIRRWWFCKWLKGIWLWCFKRREYPMVMASMSMMCFWGS